MNTSKRHDPVGIFYTENRIIIIIIIIIIISLLLTHDYKSSNHGILT